VGAKVVIDGVANAPHSAVDVKAIGADFYVLSLYKVFGPHLALLFGTNEAWAELEGPNHFFFQGTMPYKFELGCQPYESLAGFLGTADYLAWLGNGGHDRPTLEKAFAAIGRLEEPVKKAIAGGLGSFPSIRLVGPRKDRHPTFSFVHRKLPSDGVVKRVNGPDLGIRYGHMYAHRLCQRLGVPTETGVVRISAVHYNTTEEVRRLLSKLEQVL
jgi:selenocysteine lyase/cysteine desulfurase